jgi:hypothetical protein
MPDIIIESRDGRRRRARKGEVLADGERAIFPYIADLAAFGFRPTFSDGTPDHTNPHRPGYRFADTNDEGRLATERAYRARSQRMQDGWKRKDQQQDEKPVVRTQSLDELRRTAAEAYAARNARLQNAWRNRD